MKRLASVRRWVLRKPHWSSLAIAFSFGVVAWVADHSLLSVVACAFICFWILHLAGKFAGALAIGALSNTYYGPLQWLQSGPHHLMGMNEWFLVLHTIFFVAWLMVGLLAGPVALGELSEFLSKRSNKEVSPRLYLALMIVPFALLWFLPIGLSLY